VRKDRVPGSQIAGMTLIELMQDLSMSKLQVRLGELVRLEFRRSSVEHNRGEGAGVAAQPDG
jgi:hypothetical protein